MAHCNQLTHHSLFVSNWTKTVSFYQQKLGMRLLAALVLKGKRHAVLGFTRDVDTAVDEQKYPMPPQPLCYLVLIESTQRLTAKNRGQSGYWKIAISVGDLDIARSSLVSNQVKVGEAFEVPDVGYMCHFEDPDGYCIELIQHHFRHNQTLLPANASHHLGTPASLTLITYRISNPVASLKFYCDLLGLKLLSRQVIEAFGFTLYFLSCAEDTPPLDDIDAIEIREWLWQRPYAMIELQHVWRTDGQSNNWDTRQRSTGFESLSFTSDDGPGLLQAISNAGYAVQQDNDDSTIISTARFRDPDGYRIRLIY